MTPTIGAHVLFVNGDQLLPAIITDPAFVVLGETTPQQALTVFQVDAPPFWVVASFDPDGAPGTWRWAA